MKKYLLLLLFIIFTSLSVFTIHSQTLMVDGVNYSVDTLENHQVGPSTQYIALRLKASNRLDVYFLKTDLKNPHIQIRTALGRDSIYSGERPSALAKRKSTEGAFYFAGTNGDFYQTTGYVGYPIGGSMVEGEIAKTPIDWNAFIIDEDKIPDIGIVSYSGNVKTETSEHPITTINHIRNANALVLYNRHNGLYTRTNPYGTEVLVQLLEGYSWATNRPLKAKVQEVVSGVGSMAIPKGKAVLSGHGKASEFLKQLKQNDEIEINLNLSVNENDSSNFTQMTGGDNYAMMLKDGIVETSNVWNDRHPRTGIGYSQNRDTLIMCVVDGRGLSAGVTTKQLAELMKSAGAYNAINMDGGGSSCMYIEEYKGSVNKNSDAGGERAVSNSIFIVSTAPTDSVVAEIKPHNPIYSLPSLGEYTPKFYAYNQYGVLLSSDLQGVELSCPSSLGTISGNKFIATGDTPGKITATYKGDIVTSIDIRFLPVSGIKIRLDTVIIDNRETYPIEVLATTSVGDALISSEAFTWDVENPEICSVEKGEIKAIKNGQTKLIGSLGNVSGELIVKVEIPSAPSIIGDSILLDDWKVSASSFLNAKLEGESVPESWATGFAVNFVYEAGRAPYITLLTNKKLYGLPDTVKVTFNLGDVAFSRAIFTLKNNLSASATKEFNSFVNNEDITFSIPLDELFNVNDRAIYPIRFGNVKFFINIDGMVIDKNYSLAIKDIVLVYKDFVGTNVASNRENTLQVYPNPVQNEQVIIRLNEAGLIRTNLRLIDTSGRIVINKEVQTDTSGQILLSTAGVLPGIYFLSVEHNGNKNVVKLVIQ